jgi:hypothetical protein
MGRVILMIGIVCLTLAGCQSSQQGARVDPALSTLVPPDTTILVGIRAEELMKLPLYQRYLADRPIGPLDEFAQRTGLNARTDVWEVLLITNGKDNVVLGRGKFANEAEPRLKLEGDAKRFNYKTYNFVGDEETAVLFLGPTVAGFGSTAGLRRVVDTRDTANGPPAVLAKRMQEVPREAVIWAAYGGGGIDLGPRVPPNFQNVVKILNSVESGMGYVDLRLGLAAKATGSAATEPAAKELHDALRGLLGFARLGLKDKAGTQSLLDGIRVTQDARVVNVYIDAPEEAVGQLFDALAGQTQTQKGPPRLKLK